MADFEIHFENNSDEVRKKLKQKLQQILVAWGKEAERLVTQIAPSAPKYGGNLKQSITFQEDVSKQEVTIGSVAEYATYVEMGTGIYYPGGRPTPWSWLGADGKWRRTRGMEAQPYLKPGVESGIDAYERIAKRILEED